MSSLRAQQHTVNPAMIVPNPGTMKFSTQHRMAIGRGMAGTAILPCFPRARTSPRPITGVCLKSGFYFSFVYILDVWFTPSLSSFVYTALSGYTTRVISLSVVTSLYIGGSWFWWICILCDNHIIVSIDLGLIDLFGLIVLYEHCIYNLCTHRLRRKFLAMKDD